MDTVCKGSGSHLGNVMGIDQIHRNRSSVYMAESTDQTLIMRTRAGEANAFGQLVQRYQTSVFNVCYRMMGTRQEAEDLAQEAFIRAYGRLHLFDNNRPFGPWMRTVATNLCLNRLQRSSAIVDPLNDIAERLTTEDEGNPETVTVQNEDAARIHGAINQLPPNYRAVIELRHFQGLSYEEIARELGLTLAAVKTNLYRARKELGKRLHAHDE